MNKLKSWQYSQNSIEIVEPIIPVTDLSDAGYQREYPGAKGVIEILKNGNRLLDMSYWGWRYHVCQELPMFAEAS